MRTAYFVLGAVALLLLGLAGVSGVLIPEDQDPELVASSEALLTRAKALRDTAADFDQDVALRSLGVNPKNGFYYRFDENLKLALIEAGSAARVVNRSEGYRADFDGNDRVPMLPGSSDYEISGGALHIVQGKQDYLRTGPGLSVPKDSIGVIEFRMRAAKATQATLFWSEETFGEKSARKLELEVGALTINLLPDGEFHTYRVNASTALRRRMRSGSMINSFGLAPSNDSTDEVSIDYVRLVPKREKYSHVIAGRTSETIGGELRSTLHVRSTASLTFPVTLPDGPVRLRFGAGILESGDPTLFTVSVVVGGETHVVSSETVESNQSWKDREVDLGAWAGKSVQIRLENDSEHGNIAFWSNPVLRGPPTEHFNVVVFLEDTLRADHLSAYGYKLKTSPAKDRFASKGVLFEYVFSQATKTRPSVPSFMTSLLPSASGVWNHRQALDERYLTLAEIMRHQGFVTASFIKNSNAGPASGIHQGFGQLFDHVKKPAAFYGSIDRWVEAHSDQNFFMYVHEIDPHPVFDPPEEYREFWRDSPDGRPVKKKTSRIDAKWVEEPTIEGRRLLYDGEIAHNDLWFGRFLENLERLGIADNTLIINIADHGEHLGERGQWSHRPPGYIQVLRVPLIMMHAELLPAGVRFVETVQLLDVLPTILELAGVPNHGLLLQGDSLVSLIEGRDPDYWRNRIALSEEATRYRKTPIPEVSGSAFYRREHYLRSKEVWKREVYDFHADPQEESPLAFSRVAALGATFDPMLEELLQIHAELRKNLTGDTAAVIETIPEAQEQLRALGYIE